MFSSVASLGCHLRAQSGQRGLSLLDVWDSGALQPVRALEPHSAHSRLTVLPAQITESCPENVQSLKVLLPRHSSGTPSLHGSCRSDILS